MKQGLHGLYVITEDRRLGAMAITASVAAALRGGARVVQYRDKTSDRARRLDEAMALAALCRDQGALLLINDDVELAAASGAHGVHLGQDDDRMSPPRARCCRPTA